VPLRAPFRRKESGRNPARPGGRGRGRGGVSGGRACGASGRGCGAGGQLSCWAAGRGALRPRLLTRGVSGPDPALREAGVACARRLRAEAAAGGGAAGTEVGAQTRGLRPVLLGSPRPSTGWRGRGAAHRDRGGRGRGRGLAWPQGPRAVKGLLVERRHATPEDSRGWRPWRTVARELRGGGQGAGWPAPPTSRDARAGNSLTGKLGRAANAKVLEELRVTSLGAEALFSFPAPCPASARLGQRRMCHQFGAAGGIPATLGTGAPETKVSGDRVAELRAPQPVPRSRRPGCRLEGRSPWGPLDGNQLARLGVDVASELCCAHIISIPPTLIKPREILSRLMVCRCRGGRTNCCL
jgi:hypothetical protein